MKLIRQFFTYVPADLPLEVPAEEPPDPNEGRALSDPFRAARRSLVAVCGISLAWSTAQFTPTSLRLDVPGASLDLKTASIPLLLAASLVYLAVRWACEFAMMPRHVRRWPLAQLDFRLVSAVARFSLLAVAAAALERSLWVVLGLVAALGILAVLSAILSVILMFVTMPIRMWARARANRISAANAAVEGLAWAGLFAVCLTVAGIVGFGAASYRYEPLKAAIWQDPPDPLAFSLFIATLIVVFLSHWLLRPVTPRLFAERPPYYTERTPDGALHMTFAHREKEPLL